MAISTLKVGYTEFLAALAPDFGISRTTGDWHPNYTADANNLIRGMLREIYAAHPWSFLRQELTIVTSTPYSTGTIAIASGVVTGTGTVFPSWAAHGWLYVDGVAYEVNTRGGDTSLTLDDLTVTVASGATYELVRFSYAMETDFAGFATPLVYSPGEGSNLEVQVQKTSVNQLRKMFRYRNSPTTGEPQLYALFALPQNPDTSDTRAIAIWPPSSEARHLTAERYVIPNDIDASDPYPAGGALYGEMFLTGLLAQVEKKRRKIVNGPLQQAFAIELAKAIEADKLLSTPDTLGSFVCSDDDRMPDPFYSPDYVGYEGHNIFD